MNYNKKPSDEVVHMICSNDRILGKKRIVSSFLLLTMLVALATPNAFATDSDEPVKGVYIDFETATDEELEEAAEAIYQEQQRRLTTVIVLSDYELNLPKGQSYQLKATVEDVPDNLKASALSWTSSNTSVATCRNGKVAAVGSGSAEITCSCKLSNGLEVASTCTVNVYVQITSISVSEARIRINKNETFSPEVTIKPADATNQTFTIVSSDTKVATVDNNGKIKAVGAGVATITLTANDGSEKTTSYQVWVPNLNFSNIKVGTVLSFGQYEQDNKPSNGAEKINWIVMEMDGDKALLLSEMILDSLQFDSSGNGAYWAKSTLRAWLNDEFLNIAFSPEAQEAILTSRLESYNGLNGNWSHSYTNDKVFVLNRGESYTYFHDDGTWYHYAAKTYQTKPTEFAEANHWARMKQLDSRYGSYYDSKYWWMRDVERTTFDGQIEQNEYRTETSESYSMKYDSSSRFSYLLYGVRPALWIDLTKADCFAEIVSQKYVPQG